jgi:hypothetical protein
MQSKDITFFRIVIVNITGCSTESPRCSRWASALGTIDNKETKE